MRRSTGFALLVLVLIACALGIARWLAGPASPAVPDAPHAGDRAAARFAGSARCAGCHAGEAAAWRRSHHAQSMAVATRETVLGDFEGVSFGSGGRAVHFSRRGPRYFVNAADRDGKRREFEVTHTFGVYPLQQYLLATGRGRLQVLDVAWDARPRARGGQRWFRPAEGEEGAGVGAMHWSAPAFNWNHQCADCHSTGLRKGYDAAADAFASTFAEVSVSCEACHGPAAAHVEWQQRQRHFWSRLRAGPRPEFAVTLRAARDGNRRARLFDASRPPDFVPGTEVQVCAQCHSRRSQLTAAFDVAEGYVNHYAPELLTAPLYSVDGQIHDEVFEYGSFQQSRMFAKGVTCSDCHEPHSNALRREGDALCLGCHEAKYGAAAHHHHPGDGPRCVDCHMAARTYMGVDPRRDHSFRVPRPDLDVSLGVPDVCTGCHADGPAQWAADRVREWFGPVRTGLQQFAPALDALRREAPGAEQAIDALLADPRAPDVAKATALAEAGPLLDEARLDWLRRGLADRNPILRLAALDACESLPMEWRWSLAAGALGDAARSVRIRAAELLGASGALDDGQQRRLAPALAEYQAAVAANADRPAWRSRHAVWLASRGQPSAALAELDAALRLDPDYTPAAVNLADLYRELGRDDEAEVVLTRALARDPDSAGLHHAMGLLRARQHRYPEALAALSRAAQLAPGEAAYRYAEAVALDSLGRRREAIAALERHQARGRASRREAALLARLRAAQMDRAKP